MRKNTLDGLSYLGLDLDLEKNALRSSEERDISVAESNARILVVPTNEELVIALDTKRIVEEQQGN